MSKAKLAALAAVLCAAAALTSEGAPQSPAANRATGGKGVLVLQTGSDWCVSGERVRKVFDGAEFRRLTGSKYVHAVYDDMDSPNEAAKAGNAEVGGLIIRTKCFPAVTCYASFGGSLHVFAQIENVPQSVDAAKLAKAVAKVAAKKDQAVRLFEKAASSSGETAADLYGEAFDILASMMGRFHFRELTEGKWAWREQWEALKALDAGDRFGWMKHFEMDEYRCVKMVESVTNARENSTGGGAAIVAAAKKIPKKHLSANQKQCIMMMEYALTYSGLGTPLTEAQRSLMEEAFELDRKTFWGQFAMGRLILDGRKIPSAGLPSAKVRERPTGGTGLGSAAFPIDSLKTAISSIRPDARLTEAQKLAIARHAALRLIGESAWRDVAQRPGSGQFMKAFYNDRQWLEDFAWSGSFPENSTEAWCRADNEDGAGARAFRALETLVFQDGGRWTPFADGRYADNEGRRFMTALAITYPDRDEAWLADVLDAYRATARSGRLHRTAYTQPVWLWRYAVHQGHGTGGCDNMAAQQRHLDKFVNLPTREGGGTPWMIEYRLKNCFGESVHGPGYYKPWATAGEWPKRKYSQIVGGVCGELSKFGSACANAHGMPSTTVGEPGHCAYSRRLPDGTWELDYSVTGHSQLHMTFWNRHPWQYSVAFEGTFGGDREQRMAADRLLELARLAEGRRAKSETVEAYFRKACNAWPRHYSAWREYGEWVARSGAPIDTMRTWLKGCARGMKSGRQPLWDLLTPYFERVAKEKDAKSLADDLVFFAPLLRQSDGKIQQESDFGVVVKEWTRPLAGSPDLVYVVLKALLEAQYGTRDYFSQTLGWGSEYFISKGSSGTFVRCLGEAIAAKAKGGAGAEKLDFAPMILAASRSDNLEAFRQMVDLQSKLAPNAPAGQKYPGTDFGGALLSSAGLFKTSSTCQWDDPSRYGLVIDDSPCGGNGFHTEKEKAPWAQVMLAGPTTVQGVVIENRAGGYNATRQVPLYVDVSEDGSSWRRVRTVEQVAPTFRVDLRGDAPRARYVRVGRVAGAKEEVFHLNKVLVYGTKLY